VQLVINCIIAEVVRSLRKRRKDLILPWVVLDSLVAGCIIIGHHALGYTLFGIDFVEAFLRTIAIAITIRRILPWQYRIIIACLRRPACRLLAYLHLGCNSSRPFDFEYRLPFIDIPVAKLAASSS